MPFVFYDLETTGRSSAFDQPLQFGAIVTDDDLNAKEHIDIRCRLAPHILPSPHALAVTGFTPDTLTDPNLPSWFEFSQQIYQLVRKYAPSTWVGYNTIKFDENFIRQSFYQNLQPNIYETQFNGNDRMDIMNAVFAVWAKNTSLLNWPKNEAGEVIFKLDQLAPANGFASHNAHDALGDVAATIHIAKLIKDGAPELWQEILKNRNKAEVSARLLTQKPLDFIARFNRHPPKTYVGCFCGFNPNYLSNAAFFDLEAADPAYYVDADDEEVAKLVKKSPKIVVTVGINKAPNLFVSESPDPEIVRRATIIAGRPDFRDRVGFLLADQFKDVDKKDLPIEQQIYGEFYSNADKALLEKFQTASWAERWQMITSFEDLRLQQLGRRLCVFEDPNSASKEDFEKANAYIFDKFEKPKEDKPAWSSYETVEAELNEIEEKAKMTADEISALRSFYSERKKEWLMMNTKNSQKNLVKNLSRH